MAVPSQALGLHVSLHLQNPSPSRTRTPRPAPTTETLRRRLLRRGVSLTPKTLRALHRKEALKSLRRARKDAAATAVAPGEDALGADEEVARFCPAAAEYRALTGRPWEGAARVSAPPPGSSKGEDKGLEGLREMLAMRKGDGFWWLLDDDLEVAVDNKQRRIGNEWIADTGDEDRKIEFLVMRYARFPALAV